LLYDNGSGQRWAVFNTGTGEYVNLTVDGAGLINNTVSLAALSTETPGGLLSYDGSGNPTVIAPAVSGTGYVLTQQASGLFAPLALPTAVGASYFEVYPNAAAFSITYGTAPTVVTTTLPFNTVKLDSSSLFNTGSYYIAIPANQVWVLYASVQLDYTSTTGNLQLGLSFTSGNVGSLYNFLAPLGRVGFTCSGVIPPMNSIQNVSVQLGATATTASGGATLTMYSNATNNRFGGFRIA
jgi:hypothetical protein